MSMCVLEDGVVKTTEEYYLSNRMHLEIVYSSWNKFKDSGTCFYAVGGFSLAGL